MAELHQLKMMPIRFYLQRQGILPQRENEQGGLYLSPLREEKIPSFKVNYVQNLWYDFGLGVGGSIIDLVMQMNRCDFTHAVQLLENNKFVVAVPTNVTVSNHSPLTIVNVWPLQANALINYLHRRRVDLDMAKRYCKEVHYSVCDRQYYAIGFQNDVGGWELRSENFKGSNSPKSITTIAKDSLFCMVFEGFMDFLSYLTMIQPHKLSGDVAVLNSVTNLSKTLPFLQQHKVVYTFLDNDEAGKKTTAETVRLCPQCEVIDKSAFYLDCKDINEYLQRSYHQSFETNQPKKRVIKL